MSAKKNDGGEIRETGPGAGPGADEPIEKATDLVDGATGEVDRFAEEIEDLRAVAADAGLSIERRLAAYEDIIDSEVGDTALVRGRNLEREFGLRQLHLKFEGGNPSGTQKDRIAFAQAADALRRGFEAITVATCGNYGVAIALAASLAGLRCIIFLPETYHTKRIAEMTDLGAEIRRVGGDYEGSVEISKRFAAESEVYDANPGGENTTIQLIAYGQIAYELYDDLRDAPAAVAVPVSNGTTLAGIYRGFLSLYRRGKTSRMPRMIAGSSARKNPIVQALVKNLPSCVDLSPGAIRETAVNEPLINWRSIDGDLALEAVRLTGGWGGEASDRALSQVSRLLRGREGLDTLPASTAGIIALVDRHRNEPLPHDRYVALLTGRKS